MTMEEILPDDPRFHELPPFPSTPLIDDAAIEEISKYEYEILAPGIVVFRNVLQFDQRRVLDYIDENAAPAHATRWTYIIAEDGEEYGINEDGFRYRPEDIPSTPVRLLKPVTNVTPEDIKQFFFGMEETIYKCLLRYIDLYPLLVGCIWWRNRGHVLRYEDQGVLGAHCDNDTNYKVTGGVRYMPRGQVAARQTMGSLTYLNDCVDTEEEIDKEGGTNFLGGHLEFFHLGVEYKPRKGDIVMFPTNYIASHQVSRMTAGRRYSYLSFFGQGSEDVKAGVSIISSEESRQWCPPVWLDNIYDDYEKFCKSPYSQFVETNTEINIGINPVYQGRCVAQYGTTHDAIEIEPENK